MSHSIFDLGGRLGIAALFFCVGCQMSPSRTVAIEPNNQQAMADAVNLNERLKKIENALGSITDEFNLARSSQQCYSECNKRSDQLEKFYGTPEWVYNGGKSNWPKSAKEEMNECREKCKPLQSIIGC